MATMMLTAEQIAERQLLAALHLWEQKEFVSAITLAGAAEEIMGKRLRRLGHVPSFDQIRGAIVAVTVQLGGDEAGNEKIIGDLLNSTRNELKHYSGDAALEFDLEADAAEMLERALANYQVLTGGVPSEALQFWSSTR